LVGTQTPLGRASAFPGDNGVIAFSSNMEDGTFEIYTVHPDGTGLTRVTRTGGNYDPAWSGDGSRLAYTSYRDGPPSSPEIYTMGPWGNEARITNHDGTDRWPALSPGSTTIAFTRHVGHHDIFLMARDGTDIVNLTRPPARTSSPPGRPTAPRSPSPAPATVIRRSTS
jgi:TolB protein